MDYVPPTRAAFRFRPWKENPMSRLTIPARDDTPDASKPILNAVLKLLGVVPNMFRLIASSPAALEGFAANSGALTLNRKGGSGDAKADAAVRFATKVVRERGTSAMPISRRSATLASTTARSWRSSLSSPKTSSPTCSTWLGRPISTSRSFASATRPDAMHGLAGTSHPPVHISP
jgi:hypothetical protein